MPVNVVMPQMGESIAEGTIARWLKKVGDVVERDEPLLEVSTDKVDAEIPSPASGVLAAIYTEAGAVAEVHAVVGVIHVEGADAAVAPPSRPAGTRVDEKAEQAPAGPSRAPALAAASAAASRADRPSAEHGRSPGLAPSGTEHRRVSPVARRIARDHQLDLAGVRGMGARILKRDVMALLARGVPTSTKAPAGAVDVVPMTVMRRKIAEHMIASRQTSAHVHSVFEVNCARIEAVRQVEKARFVAAGAKLSVMPFVISAAARALRAFPILNASLSGDQIVHHGDINIGVAVALDSGLIVPVVKHVDRLSLLELSLAVADLARRARSRQLKPEEVTGGTFTVTNPGNFGGTFATPIINQPQVAILEMGTVEKRVVVVNDALAIRPMMHLTLGFDHRLIDGVMADRFLAAVKKSLETWPGVDDGT